MARSFRVPDSCEALSEHMRAVEKTDAWAEFLGQQSGRSSWRAPVLVRMQPRSPSSTWSLGDAFPLVDD